ncbi:20232_t:CDS:1, partial [Dentiscutata erythropus]
KMQKLPAILESLDGDTKKAIMEWADMVQEKHSSDKDLDSDDDENLTYFGDHLLIFEWDETALARRNIQKNTVLTCMYINWFNLYQLRRSLIIFCSTDIRTTFPAHNFPGRGRPLSDSLFYVVDTAGVPADQIIQDILHGLRNLYLLRNVPSLGRVYTVHAERKNTFEAVEIYDVFAY